MFNTQSTFLKEDAIFKEIDKTYFVKHNEFGYTCLIDSFWNVLNYYDALNEILTDLFDWPREL